MSATVDKEALRRILAGHEIHAVTTSSTHNLGWSVVVTCHCRHVGRLNQRTDHLTDVLLDDLGVWLLPDDDVAAANL
jgi:hypothetical protein